MIRTKIAWATLALSLAWSAASPAPAAPAGGPESLLIQYRTTAARRPAFRRYLERTELARLARWKARGVLADYQVLFNPYNDQDTWDALLVLKFPAYAAVGRWQAIEQTLPGGLDARGLALATPVQTYSADLRWAEGGWGGAGNVFYVIPYEYRSEAEYAAYVEDYVLPQVRGWMRDGALSGYRIYMNRDPVGRRWDSLFVFRYRDLAAFGRREAVIAAVRAGLAADPRWAALNAGKRDVRTESDNAIAVALGPRRNP